MSLYRFHLIKECLHAESHDNRLSRPESRAEIQFPISVVAQFSIASTERWKDKNGELQERTEWFGVKAFGRRAEIAGEYLRKGSRVYLEGRKRTESWDDKKTGSKNYRDLVYVDRLEFLDSRANGNGSSRAHPTSDEQSTVPEEEIPF